MPPKHMPKLFLVSRLFLEGISPLLALGVLPIERKVAALPSHKKILTEASICLMIR